jgi:hypothetical protein
MNLAGIIPAGVLIAGFGAATVRLLSSGRRSNLAGAMISLFGVALVLGGIFSCDPGCPLPWPTGSVAATIHNIASLTQIAAAIAGIGLWALEFRQIPAFRDLWKYTALSSAAGLGFLIAFTVSLDSRVFTGLWQRLLFGTLFVWCAVVALRLYHGHEGHGPNPKSFFDLGGKPRRKSSGPLGEQNREVP